MSSRVFKARTSHSPQNPQVCGLTGVHIQKGDWCMYLVCAGNDARPEYQISEAIEETVTITTRRGSREVTQKYRETPDGRRYKCSFGGWERDPDTGKNRKVWLWQQEQDDGYVHDIVVWSNMVLAAAAENLGYRVPRGKNGRWSTTKAYEGDRTRGHEHRIEEQAESPLVTLARVALTDEEAGLVSPEESEREAIIREEQEAVGEAMAAEQEAEDEFLALLEKRQGKVTARVHHGFGRAARDAERA